MAATDHDIKDLSAEQFAQEIQRQTKPQRQGKEANFVHKQLTNASLQKLANGLEIVYRRDPSLVLRQLRVSDNEIGDDGLLVLAETLSGLSWCRATLQILAVDKNSNLTTLAPLAKAGVLDGLTWLLANECSFSAEESVLPPDLFSNLPNLKVLNLSRNQGGATITLTEQALCALPPTCKVLIGRTKVQVKLGPKEFKILPTDDQGMFSSTLSIYAKTAKEILEFAGVEDCKTYVKPARTRGTGTGMRCGACSSPRPRFACAACKTEAYCDDRCQKLAWASHKNSCFDS